MTEQASKNAEKSAEPRLQFVKQYIKDLSYESPGLVKALTEENVTLPAPQMKVDVSSKRLNDTAQEVTLTLQLHCKEKESNDTFFLLECQYAGIFALENIDMQQKALVLLVECPRLLFPYAKSLVETVIINSGFPAFSMPLIDFARLYQAQQDAAAEAKQQVAH